MNKLILLTIYIVIFVSPKSIYSDESVIKISILSKYNISNLEIKNNSESLNITDNKSMNLDTRSIKINKVNETILFNDNRYKKLKIKSINSDDYLIIYFNNKIKKYYGEIEITIKDNQLSLILYSNKLNYVASVLSSEVNYSDPLEFKKALAIIISNYSNYMIHNRMHQDYDVCDQTHCQLFDGDIQYMTEYKNIVKDLLSYKLECNSTTSFVSYTACCGGKTFSSQIIWNQKDECDEEINCNYCSKHKFYKWENRIKKDEILKVFNLKNKNIKAIQNYPDKILFILNDTSIFIKKDKLRIMVGRNLVWNKILSNNYELFLSENKITIQGHGFGHNVGLCVEGAKELAKNGKKFYEIINYYFPKFHLYDQKN